MLELNTVSEFPARAAVLLTNVDREIHRIDTGHSQRNCDILGL